MGLNKVNYIDKQTVITAANLNNIQDAIISLESATPPVGINAITRVDINELQSDITGVYYDSVDWIQIQGKIELEWSGGSKKTDCLMVLPIVEGQGMTIKPGREVEDPITLEISPDAALSATSTNAVQNKVITAALDGKQATLSTNQLKIVNNANLQNGYFIIGGSANQNEFWLQTESGDKLYLRPGSGITFTSNGSDDISINAAGGGSSATIFTLSSVTKAAMPTLAVAQDPNTIIKYSDRYYRLDCTANKAGEGASGVDVDRYYYSCIVKDTDCKLYYLWLDYFGTAANQIQAGSHSIPQMTLSGTNLTMMGV